ncbi:MAG: anthranilate phosphoribosyltransferase [Phycisphaeraceae bacterium]
MSEIPSAIQPLLRHVAAGEPLSLEQSREAFELVMTGQASGPQVAALLTALQVRPGGPTVDELTGAAQVMRQHVAAVRVPEGMTVVDTCGTGGDHAGTFNISTTAALIAAGAGAHVAKHGNRSVTSSSGSSQVLEALGVTLNVDGETLVQCLEEVGLCFCFAPAHHPAMKHAGPVRQHLGFRTIFNLLGPLTNPAGAKRQLIGVFEPGLTEPIAQVLTNLGAEHAMVVHGAIDGDGGGGLDELTITGTTRITTTRNGAVTSVNLDPSELGLERRPIEKLRVASVEESAAVVKGVLEGEPGPARDIATLNAAAALVVADQAVNLTDGLAQAREAIDSGAARETLAKLVRVTQG